MDSGSGVSWEDIAGLKTAKDFIEETFVLPSENPDLFKVRHGGIANGKTI